MAFEPIPYAINGEQLSANMLRRQLYKQSYGRSGVTLPGDLKVTQLPTPGAGVRIAAGGGTAENKFPGGANQSYDVTAPSVTDLSVSATGGSASTREVIVRIYDPQFAGSKPSDGIYVKPILVSALPTDYPFIWLATIAQPANTGTITNAMLTDRRILTAPRSWQEVYTRPTLVTDPAAGMLLTATAADGEWFPNAGGEQYVPVPAWATHMQIEADWMAVLLGPEGSSGWGDYWIDYGEQISTQKLAYSTAKYRWDMPSGDYSRNNWRVKQEVPVPAAYRGTTQQFLFKARKEGNAVPKMDHRSGVALTVNFIERIV